MPKGSHTTRGGWEPRTCTTCGKPIVITRQSCTNYFDDTTNTAYAWHTTCSRPVTLNKGGGAR